MKLAVRLSSLLGLAILLSGCQLWPFQSPKEKDTPKTLAELLNRSVTIRPSRLPQQSLTTALAAYSRVLDNPAGPAARQEALTNLARLHSLLAENALADNQMEAMQQHLAQAAKYYETLLREFRNTIDVPAIEYQLARVLALRGDTTGAYQRLSAIANTHDSRFEGIEAHFRLAEHAFAQGQYTEAAKAYGKVIRQGLETPFFTTALYKRGWALFKLSQYTSANADFAKLLDYLHAHHSDTTPEGLRSDTLRILALSFSYLDGPMALRRFFTQRGHKPWEAALYQALADQYFEQERFQDTAKTLQTYVETNPNAHDAPLFAHRAITVLEKAGFVDLVLAAKQQFVLRYQSGTEYWQHQPSADRHEFAPQLKQHLDDLMAFFHAEAQRKKTPADFLNAAKWYEIYLKEFPNASDAPDKRWLLAEAYVDAGRISDGADQYEQLAYGPESARHARAEQAGYRLIVLRQRLLRQADKTHQGPARHQLIDAALRYVTAFPKSQKLTEILSLLMEEQIAAGQIAASIDTASQLLMRPDGQRFADRARSVIADGLFDLGKYHAAEKAISAVLNRNKLTAKEKARYHRLRAQAIYKQGELAQKQGQDAHAIAHYLRLVKLEPQAPESAQAKYDAATLMLKLGRYRDAIDVLNQFQQQHPQHPLGKTIPAKLIVAYEAIGAFDRAAQIYTTIAKQEKDPERKRVAYWQAAESWEKVSNEKGQKAAVLLWKQYIKHFPTPYELNAEAMQRLINLYEALGIGWKRDFWRRKLVGLVLKKRLSDARVRTLAANAQLALANAEMLAFKRITLKQPLAKSLAQKKQAMKKVLSAYAQVLEIGVRPMATEAAFRIGEAYQHLAKALLASPRPKGLSELALEEYNALLEEKVYPFEDKAIEAYEATWSLVQEGIWDSWTQKAFDALKQLVPARYEKPFMVDDYAN